MSTYCIKADAFVLPGHLAGPGYLTVHDGVFGTWSKDAPEGIEVLDRSGSWVGPGYVDTHIHGFLNYDVMDCDAEGINAASRALAQHGTTSWTPTTLTQPVEEIRAACEAVYKADTERDEDFAGAHIEGIFLEGPFFTEKYKGAQNPANMFDPDVDVFCDWQDAAHGLICKSALAAERKGAEHYCAELHKMGVTTAIGHSNATYEEGLACVAAGARVFVHTYNAMSGLHHRDPGLVGCAMTTKDTYAELICDGQHVKPAAAEALIRAKGWDHVVVVSDCLRCGGMPEGDYMLGDFPIRMSDNLAHIVLEDGSEGAIAGSVATLALEAKNLFDWGIVTAEQAIRMCSEIPARSCGIDDTCGQMLPGRCADFNVLAPDLTLQETYIEGRLVKLD